MLKKSIGILICYFGKFPWYFDYFVHSCRFNPSIDFFIVSDIAYDQELPQNVKIIPKTLDEVSQLASKKLEMDIHIEYAYKMCDFKPAYGLIFSEILAGYDFWGQSDIDIIYGDIRAFMSDELLTENSFISIRHDYTTGCFALYKNIPLINNLFKRSTDFEKVFTNTRHYCFDECNFVHDLLSEGSSIFDIPTEIESFTHVVLKAVEKNELKAHFDFLLIEGLPGKLTFDHGKVLYRQKFEGVLYHLYWLKRDYKPRRRKLKIPDKYYISPNQIYFR